MFDFAITNNGKARQAALPLMESDRFVDIEQYSFGVRVVEKIKLQKNIQHGKKCWNLYRPLETRGMVPHS
jgi:hypothetical protein